MERIKVSTTNAKAMFCELLSRVQFRRESFVIHRRNKDIAVLAPIKEIKREIVPARRPGDSELKTSEVKKKKGGDFK